MTRPATEAPYVSGKYVRFRDELPLDASVARLAERQHGVVALHQLEALGLAADAVRKRAASGRLHRVHRGVYAVGHRRLTRRGHWMAAVLACGPGAALSHRAAAAALGLLASNRANTDVVVPGRRARARSGIDVHTSLTLTAADLTIVDGTPCTSVARTLVDLGDVVRPRLVERAVNEAEVLQLFDRRTIEGALARSGPHKGVGVLRRVLAELSEPGLTRAELEERFLALCRRAALVEPKANQWLTLDDGTALQVDFLWRPEGLIVETDGYAFHGSRRSFENDRLRDQRLRLAGFEVVRFTWRQVVGEANRVAKTIRALLAR